MRFRSSLTDPWLQLRDELEIRMARPEVVDAEVHSHPTAYFAQHARTKLEVGEQGRFGNL